MNAAIQIPGLTNAWTMPIKTRIDMLSTGIKTPVGIKIAGPDLAELGAHRRRKSKPWSATSPARPASTPSASMGGNYIEFNIDRDEIARYGLTVGDVQDVLEVAPRRHAADDHRRGPRALHRSTCATTAISATTWRRCARHRRADADRRADSARPARHA